MKNTGFFKSALLLLVLLVGFAAKSQAQNIQLHYDMRRNCATSTVEMFRADNYGSTFFFVDMDFAPKAFVDLQKIVCEWGIRDKSVKKMAGIILGFRISKTQQLSNWEADKLSESQCKYAATDAWVCREMYLKLLASEKNPLVEPEPETK